MRPVAPRPCGGILDHAQVVLGIPVSRMELSPVPRWTVFLGLYCVQEFLIDTALVEVVLEFIDF